MPDPNVICSSPGCQTTAGCKCNERSYFHLVNGYPHNTEARQKIRELIEWFHGGASCTPGLVESVLEVIASHRSA